MAGEEGQNISRSVAENIRLTESRFNPAIPEMKAPDWYRDSRSISQPASPKGGEYLFSGLAALTGEAVHGLDTAQKIGLDEEVRAGIDKIRNKQIKDMQEARETLGGMVTAGKPIPKDLASLSENLSALDNARANGKISLTDYDGRLNQFLSEVRGRNPGYRDYIDETVHKTLGYEPANMQIRQLAMDINAMTAAKKSENDWMIKEVTNNYSGHSAQVLPGGPAIGADQMAAGLRSGQYNNIDFIHWKMPYDALKTQYERHKWAEPLDEKNARDMANGLAFSKFNADMNGLMVMTGHGQFKIQENLARAAAGEFVGDKETWMQAGAGLESVLASSRQSLMAEYRKVFQSADGSSTSINAIIKDGELEKIIDDQEKHWRSIISLIEDQQFSPAYAKMRLINDIQTGVAAKFLTNEQVGPILANMDYLQKALPPEMFKEIVDKLHEKAGFNKAIWDWAFSKQVEALSGNPSTPNSTKPPSIQDTLQEGKDKGIIQGDAYKSLFTGARALADPTLPDREFHTLTDYYFNPRNRNALAILNRDYTDSQGRVIQGKYAAFDLLTQPKITDAIASRGSANDKTNYKNTVDNFLSELWRTDIRDLSAIKALHWNNTTHQWILPPMPNVSEEAPEGSNTFFMYYRLESKVNDVNQALEQYTHVIEASKGTKDPSQVDVEILKTLAELNQGAGLPLSEIIKATWKALNEDVTKFQQEQAPDKGYSKK